MSWKLSVVAPRLAIEAALERQECDPNWDDTLVITGFEIAPDQPELWQLDGYVEDKPSQAQRNAIKALFDGPAPYIRAERLPDADWVTESQKGMDPIRAGRFHVRTPDHPRSLEPGVRDFCIPAAQAFGTGQHATTAGCLTMLDTMKQRGVVARNLADIGTGTGLLAFAALHLWPHARAVGSDIDPVCLPAVEENAALNGVKMGIGPGQLEMVIAEGMEDHTLQDRALYDLLIANILAGPLIDLAPDFAATMAPRSHIVLSGLLTTQEAAVRAAYHRVGFRLQARLTQGDWSILWLRQRYLF
jgi:ribosomal protein L11 methyltransferase